MNLRDYLYYNKISVKDFSKNLDYSRTHISAIIHGRLKPTKRLAKAIEQATNGEVKAEDLISYKEKRRSIEVSKIREEKQ